ncbi:isoprenyl transferase [Sporosalibacterium faouarense]|uniref:isoprenyl transferase n=1 Tax=Sporosalibacterium faouarense TaxID=516123 RepID=UPI00141C5DA6|nr:isoprenyl transferase [Sporosalibacterium faouarense]MTI48026.1 isoprenyl transferase [Bacillota bacterium]
MYNEDTKSFEEIKKEIDLDRLPQHIAIIMDGNGRWAKGKMLPRSAGHKAGVERVKEIVKAAGDLGINYLTLYAFSTENWKRPKDEVESLMNLLVLYIRGELNNLHKNGVKIKVLGDIEKIPLLPRREINKAIKKTKDNDKLILNIALNYGGRYEITRAAQLVATEVKNGMIDVEEITPDIFKKHLYTKEQPDPDLLIRPSGELRISNFLLFQIAYTEFWFSDVYWPDFTKSHLCRAIIDFQKRVRRYGGIKG